MLVNERLDGFGVTRTFERGLRQRRGLTCAGFDGLSGDRSSGSSSIWGRVVLVKERGREKLEAKVSLSDRLLEDKTKRE